MYVVSTLEMVRLQIGAGCSKLLEWKTILKLQALFQIDLHGEYGCSASVLCAAAFLFQLFDSRAGKTNMDRSRCRESWPAL